MTLVKVHDIKEDDKLVKQVAVFLCELWDDDWQEGERFHTSNAKQLINMIGLSILDEVVTNMKEKLK